MAEASVLFETEEFCCSVCLDLLKDPVTLSCGHSFCMNCINSFWNHQKVHSCPQCRETFDPRPALRKNHMLAEVVEKLRGPGLSLTADCYTTPGDVECDICTGRKRKAVKSCLVCLASYCKVHFQPHDESAALKKHTVTEVSAHLREKICPQHEKLLEVYCRTDQKCICYLCALDEHSGHKIVSAVAERPGKEKLVFEAQNMCKQRIRKRKGEHQELMKSIDSLTSSTAVKDTEVMFSKLIRCIKKKCSEVIEQIRTQEKAELSRAKKHLKKVEGEIDDLRKTEDKLQHLSQIEDDIHYLQIFSLHGFCKDDDFPRIKIDMVHSPENVEIFVFKLIHSTDNFKLCPDSSSQSQLKDSFGMETKANCTCVKIKTSIGDRDQG